MREVSLFIPCGVDTVLVEVGQATVNLIEALGCRTIYHEEQTCCGQPAVSGGYKKLARQLAKRFISIFEKDDLIVSPSGSCVLTVKKEYPRLLADEPDWQRRAIDVGSRLFELSQFITDVLGKAEIGGVYHGTVAYHESCHLLRGLGISEQPKKLLQSVEGTTLIPLKNADVCCGFGGQFAARYPDISENLVKAKVSSFLAANADILIVSEPGCLLNIDGYLHRHYPEKRVTHLACFLSDAVKRGEISS